MAVPADRLRHPDSERDQCANLQVLISLAVRSLSGEELEPNEWQALGMTPTSTAAHEAFEPNDQWLETVLLVLLEIARSAESLIVLCFDQMENLSEERFVELFRFNHALLDHGRNLLIITSGVRSDLFTLREQRLAPEAAWDRLAGETIDLFFIGLNEYAWLAALEAVLGDSRSGDLEVELPNAGLQRVTETETEQSHHRCGRYYESPLIRWLAETLTGDRRTTDKPPPARGGDDARGRSPNLRDCILGELQLVAGIAARELAERLHERFASDGRVSLDEFARLVHDEAQRLHRERRLQATPTADDLFLLLRP